MMATADCPGNRGTNTITMNNGKLAAQGVCPVCETKMFRIGKAKVDTAIIRITGNTGYLRIGG